MKGIYNNLTIPSQFKRGGVTMLTQERKNIISGILNEDKQRAKELLALEPSEALIEINKLGYNFTIEEIKEFGKVTKDSNELDFELLESVSGGAVNNNNGCISIW